MKVIRPAAHAHALGRARARTWAAALALVPALIFVPFVPGGFGDFAWAADARDDEVFGSTGDDVVDAADNGDGDSKRGVDRSVDADADADADADGEGEGEGEGDAHGRGDRDEAMFTGDDADGLGGSDRLSAIRDQLEDAKRFLELGGALWLWLEYDALADGALKAFELRSPSFVDLYADARPTDRLRGFVQGRIKHDFTVADGATDILGRPRPETEVLLDQLWIKTDILRRVFVTVGRQRVRWGVGRFWNPTDFLNSSRRDPLAVFDQRLGVSLVRFHVPLEAYGWNFYAIANVEDANRLDAVGGALRAEILVGQTEISVSGAFQKDQPLRLGADVSMGVGWLDLKGEVAVQHGVKTPFFRGPLIVAERLVPSTFSREDEWVLQATGGAELSIPIGEADSIVVGAEYFYNRAGYADEALYPWLIYQRQWSPLYVGRHYGGVYALVAAPGRWDDTTFLLSGLSNLSDGSALARLDYSVRVFRYLDLRAFGSVHLGSEGELRLRVDVDPTTLVPGLEQGVHVSPPSFEVGVTMSMAL